MENFELKPELFCEDSELLVPVEDIKPTLVHEELDPNVLELKEILSGFGLDNLEYVLQRCLSSKIFARHLKVLETDDINALIPIDYLGDRAIFKVGVKALQSNANNAKADLPTVSTRSENSTAKSHQSVSKEGTLFKNTNLSSILKKSVSGSIVLTAYEKNHILFPQHQKLLVDCIIDYLMQNKIALKSKELDRITTEIVRLFPTESRDTYYLKSTINGKNPSGKLYNRYNNVKRKLQRFGYMKREKR